MARAGDGTIATFVVIAEFRVRPEQLAAFLETARDDATHSVADEPGCRQFDVVQQEGEDGSVVFYEVYDSREAFDAHLQTPHLKRFQTAFPPLILEELPVRFLQRHYP